MDRTRPWTPAAHNACAESGGWGTRCYATLAFERPELNALRDVWFDVVKEKGVPSRADFNARTLKPFLTNITLLDRVSQPDGPQRYRIRLMGSAIARLFGDQTGRFIDEFIPAANLPRWTMGFDTVLDGGVPLRFISRFELPRINFLDGESFSAPLASDGGRPCGILSALYVKPKEHVSVEAG